MKNTKNIDLAIIKKALNTKGKIESVPLKKTRSRKKNQQEPLYQAGGIFKLVGNSSSGVINGITYTKPRSRKAIPLPCFMGMKPTYYVKDNYLHIVFLLGSEPCELHRLIFCIEFFDMKKPNFDFYLDTIFDKCKCDDDAQFRTYALIGGLGNGTWN